MSSSWDFVSDKLFDYQVALGYLTKACYIIRTYISLSLWSNINLYSQIDAADCIALTFLSSRRLADVREKSCDVQTSHQIYGQLPNFYISLLIFYHSVKINRVISCSSSSEWQVNFKLTVLHYVPVPRCNTHSLHHFDLYFTLFWMSQAFNKVLSFSWPKTE